MPPASLRFIRAAWLWFTAGLLLGGVLIAAKIAWIDPRLLGLRIAHVHVMGVGWLAQWVFGIAFWIYPAWGSERTGPRAERLSRACWILLNAGTLVRAVCEGAYDCGAGRTPAAWGLAAGGAAQIAAGLLFVWLIRGRIRGAKWIRRDIEARRGGSDPAATRSGEPG